MKIKTPYILSALVIFLSSLASAYITDPIFGLGDGMNKVMLLFQTVLGPVFSILLGGYGDQLFERILFFFIIMSVVYVVVSNREPFKGKKPIIWIITISVSLLATRYLTENQLIQGVLLPYGLFGVLITSALPFIIYFVFVESFSGSSYLRRFLWILFIVTYLGIWQSRYDDVGPLSWIYLITAIIAILSLIFDGTIQRIKRESKYRELDYDQNQRIMAHIRREMDELEEDYWKKRYTTKQYEKEMKRLRKQLKDLRKR